MHYSINEDKITKNIIPSTQNLIKELTTAKDIISSTKIAEDFNYYTELKYTIPENIANSKDEMEKFKSWLEYVALKAQYLEEINGILVGEELGEIDAEQTKANLESFLKSNPDLDANVLKLIATEVVDECGEGNVLNFYDIIKDVYQDDISSIVDNGNFLNYMGEKADYINSDVLEMIAAEVFIQTGMDVTNDLLECEAIYSTEYKDLRHGNDAKDVFDFSEENNKACCATYINAILYRTGALSEEEIIASGYHSASKTLNALENSPYWEKVEIEDLQPGDIIGWKTYNVNGEEKHGHVALYCGGNLVLDQNSGVKHRDGRGGATEGPIEELDDYIKERGSLLRAYRFNPEKASN